MKTLLYAEDDKESRENFVYILSTLFDTIYTASNGKEALDSYARHAPDVVLLDISMPYIDGLNVAKIIRKDNQNVSIVILTAHSQKDKLLRAVNLKLDGYLLKPLDDILLLDKMRNIISGVNNKQNNLVLAYPGLQWNKNRQELYTNNIKIKLTKKELLLIDLLCKNNGSCISVDDIIFYVWYDELPDFTHSNKVIQLISRINAKVNTITKKEKIVLVENIYGYGYVITCKENA